MDDGSPDTCPQICDEYAAKDDRVKVIHQQNAGQAVARNAGLDNVKDLLPRIIQKKYLLKYSRDKRVVIFRWLQFFFGVRGVLCLLRVVKKLNR